MRKGRRLFVGGLVSAGLSLLLAPRVAGSRRAALSRLRARGAASGAFAGTPCAAPEASDTVAVVGREAAPALAAAARAAESTAPAASRDTAAGTRETAAAPREDAAASPVDPSVTLDPKEEV